MIRVLIIDDEKAILNSIPRILRKHSQFVCTPCTPVEALERVSSGEEFDVVLSDVMMDGVDGVEIHSKISSMRPELARRYVFMSGGYLEELREQLRKHVVLDKLELVQTIVPALENAAKA